MTLARDLNGGSPAPDRGYFGPPRAVYADGQVLTAEALRRGFEHASAHDRLHAGLAHTAGVLEGLLVLADGETSQVFVERGAAIDGLGRLILVPARIGLTPEMVRTDSRPGKRQVELLFLEEADEASDATCGEPQRWKREGFWIRLRRTSAGSAPGSSGSRTVLDEPLAPESIESAVRLGTVHWDGQAFSDPELEPRDVAGVRARVIEDPDGRAALALGDDRTDVLAELRDGAGETWLRVEPAGDASRVWIEGRASMGAVGVGLRRAGSAPSVDREPAAMWLEAGAAGPDAEGPADGAEDVDEGYKPGELELRIQFEDGGVEKGTHRFAIGHPDVSGGFDPAFVIYDRPSGGASTTVEVRGDLRVLGTARLASATRLGGDDSDTLDAIVQQLAGPAGQLIKLYLSGDEYLDAQIEALRTNSDQIEKLREILGIKESFDVA